jgi:hypothetical protein
MSVKEAKVPEVSIVSVTLQTRLPLHDVVAVKLPPKPSLAETLSALAVPANPKLAIASSEAKTNNLFMCKPLRAQSTLDAGT